MQEHLNAAIKAEREYRYAEMARQAELALAAADESGTKKAEQALAHRLAGTALQVISNHSEASEHFRRGSELFDELQDDEHLIECELGLGESLIRLGELPRAAHIIEAASAKAVAFGMTRLIARAQLGRGDMLWMEEEYDRAIEEIEGAIAAYAGLNDDHNEHRARCTLGIVLMKVMRLDEAEAAYIAALEYFQRVKNSTMAAKILHNLAGVSFFRMDYSRAREYILQVLELEEETESRGDRVRSLFNLGLIELRTRNLKLASKYFNLTLVTAQDIGDRTTEAVSLLHLGIICLLESNPKEALNYANLCLGRLEGSDNTFVIGIQTFMPIFHLAANQLERARELWDGGSGFQSEFSAELAHRILTHLSSREHQQKEQLDDDAMRLVQTWLQQLDPE